MLANTMRGEGYDFGRTLGLDLETCLRQPVGAKLQLAWMAFGRSHNHQNTRKKRSLDGETDEDGVSLSLERSSSHLEEASG